MTKNIEIFGISEPNGINSMMTISDNLSWLRKNVDLMEFIHYQWEINEIDNDTLSVVMNEGFKKVSAFLDVIEEASLERPEEGKRLKEVLNG